MITLFASLVNDVDASLLWLWGTTQAAVSAVAAVPAAIVALF